MIIKIPGDKLEDKETIDYFVDTKFISDFYTRKSSFFKGKYLLTICTTRDFNFYFDTLEECQKVCDQIYDAKIGEGQSDQNIRPKKRLLG